MPTSVNVAAPAGTDDVDALFALIARSFNIERSRLDRLLDVVGAENLRVATIDDTIAGGLALIRMGQYFGGRALPMAGVSIVGTDPTIRGRGVARTLMCETMRELHEERTPLSTLYPATRTLYRRAGYELAGMRWETTIRLGDLEAGPRPLSMRIATDNDHDGIDALYARIAARRDGNLDRRAFSWRRVRMHPERDVDGYVVERHGVIEGYVYYTKERGADGWSTLTLNDCMADTQDAALTLLAFLHDHRSMMPQAVSNLAPTDLLLDLVPEWAWSSKASIPWMLRLTHVPAALEGRGYPAGVEAELDLRVHDEIVPGNDGPFRLRISGGRASVEPGGNSSVEVGVRDLAAIYSAYRRPTDVARLGSSNGGVGLRGPDSALALLDTIFAGHGSFMPDMF